MVRCPGTDTATGRIRLDGRYDNRRSHPERARTQFEIDRGARLTILNAFELVHDGGPVAVPMSADRLVAFLARHDRPLIHVE